MVEKTKASEESENPTRFIFFSKKGGTVMASLREAFRALTEKLKEESDGQELIYTVEDIISECGRYIERVNNMESALTVARFRMEPEDYRKYIEELDKQRRITHNSLIVGIKLINRLCLMCNLSTIYKGNTANRIGVADFAKQVVDEMFETRKI